MKLSESGFDQHPMRCPRNATVLLQCDNRFVNPFGILLKSLIFAALHKMEAAVCLEIRYMILLDILLERLKI